MKNGRTILAKGRFTLTIERLCRQLIEEYDQFENTCIIGIQPKGTFLADRIVSRLKVLLPEVSINYGQIDITFYRDDFRRRDKPLEASPTNLSFPIENKKVILIDDVLYTGRTVQAALTGLNYFGRPSNVELLVLVDRRFNRHLPIKSDFTGITVDALDEAYVSVAWANQSDEDQVILFPRKQEPT